MARSKLPRTPPPPRAPAPPAPTTFTRPPTRPGTIPPSSATLPPRSGAVPPRPGTTAVRNPGSATLPPRSGTVPPRSATLPPRAMTPPPRSTTVPGRAAAAARPAATVARQATIPGSTPRPGVARSASPPPRAPAESPPGKPRRKRRGIRFLAAAMLLLACFAAGGGYFWLRYEFNAPGPASEPLRFQVAQGESLKGVLAQLASLGAISDPHATAWYLRLTQQQPRIQVGTYEISPQASPAKIIEQLEQGRVILEQLTVIEGSTFADFRRALDTHPQVTHALKGKSDAQVMAALGHADQVPEGRFFPDTYRFAALTSDLDILAMAYDKMQTLVTTSWPQRAADLPISTPYEALTLASIVEKESGIASERPRIAGVFVNRLRAKMRLQTDPSVIYGLGDHYDGTIHTKDLSADTPYNTYTRAGLPPTPIALPSKESVLAALHPAPTEELYFVATGNGGHHFSKTLEEHNAAVKTYLAHLKAQSATGGR
jgi:UPF0755 protein